MHVYCVCVDQHQFKQTAVILCNEPLGQPCFNIDIVCNATNDLPAAHNGTIDACFWGFNGCSNGFCIHRKICDTNARFNGEIHKNKQHINSNDSCLSISSHVNDNSLYNWPQTRSKKRFPPINKSTLH